MHRVDRDSLQELIVDAQRHVESARAKAAEASAAAAEATGDLRDVRLREADMFRSAAALQERTLALLERLMADPDLV